MDLTEFNSLDREAAVAAVGPALDVQRWIEELVSGRPYGSTEAILDAARSAANPFTDAEVAQALLRHPMIGQRPQEDSAAASLSRNEQAGLSGDDDAVKAELAQANLDYQDTFGHVGPRAVPPWPPMGPRTPFSETCASPAPRC